MFNKKINIMEELLKELKKLGYNFVWDKNLDAWKVYDKDHRPCEYLTSVFTDIVSEHKVKLGCGFIQNSNETVLYVRFKKQ